MKLIVFYFAVFFPIQALADVASPYVTSSPSQHIIKASHGEDKTLVDYRREWAEIKYQSKASDEAKVEQLEALATKLGGLAEHAPDNLEAQIWQATALSTKASLIGGVGALGDLKKAKKIFENVLEVNPKAGNGQAHVILGALYHKVPGWPIAFGNKKKAKKNLEAGIALNPDGMEPNYFYAEFLVETKDYAAARTYLKKAMAATDMDGFPVFAKGRKAEAREMLNNIEGK